MTTTYLERLAHAIRELHRCECRHLRTVPVSEVFKGREIWSGVVEVFALEGHAKAKHAYAWGYSAEVVTVLEIPPVTSPETAVKVAIASHKT